MEMPAPDPKVLSRKAHLAARLAKVLPADALITEEAETRAYECDALTAYKCPPLLAVLPRSTAEVSEVLRICHEEGVPVVPRGSGTSLAGGALPTADCVILGVARMNDVLETDYENRIIRVQTGRTNLSVSGAVEEEDFFYAPDPSSQLACAIAGNIAMNSGGAHCLKYGVTTNNLMGVTMVMMDGTVVEIGGAHLDAGGLDLLGVICGSEGQLGVVTEATLRILHKPEGARPVLIGYDSNEVAGACVSDIIKAGVLPVAIEFMDRPCIEACEAFAKAGYPMCEALLIIEVEGSDAEIDAQLKVIKDIAQSHNPVELREATDADEAARIWLGRKSAFGAMGQINDYMCLDGTIPVSSLPYVLRRIGEMSQEFGLAVANVFHAGDGNMHPLILFDANKPGDLELCEEFGAEVLKLCVEVGGCLTGEHGVGIEKRDLMLHQYSGDDLEAQLKVKDVFDPQWLLNPAKVFPLSVTESRRTPALAAE
ncbi:MULTISPECIES: FAD-linked oxidase C-terminal domain-containing protein [Rhodobacterales]|jgi:glycolate oxidase|uniref:FAD-linked oxidase C-terminal domain-containing protein n=1 Tax=Rhodobacterales TaxID=204455 RepID=UPI00237FA98B|nr:FAD-linked oxidase C-terminal domain-containing protein [Phaeobacter gallaeciensis]MDE4098565.1 FAD-linked oxidase C-terminal domain-containing protein [Phaeobacter gallaeciensis]MDE4107375.1 FAD-linked oxidase C-terminal domain-containing protein [Phaeobacter gallaeciensis]MDE4111673.1 FAD-linked oxidase C-terminal domain-containing protein [Phaeobacter gallaeciensis]MDE4116300.1 FAD-linked oxidase C-terminal domain-containing protein [Phaeobacter gallaeciensis]MDE4120771.1 FAD-linked oxid